MSEILQKDSNLINTFQPTIKIFARRDVWQVKNQQNSVSLWKTWLLLIWIVLDLPYP